MISIDPGIDDRHDNVVSCLVCRQRVENASGKTNALHRPLIIIVLPRQPWRCEVRIRFVFLHSAEVANEPGDGGAVFGVLAQCISLLPSRLRDEDRLCLGYLSPIAFEEQAVLT